MRKRGQSCSTVTGDMLTCAILSKMPDTSVRNAKKSGQNMIATGGMGIGTMKQINDHDSYQAEEAHGIHVNLSRIAVSPLTRLLFSLCCALEVTVPKRVHVINDKAHWSVWETALPVLGTGMTNPKTSGNGNLNIYIIYGIPVVPHKAAAEVSEIGNL